MNVETVTQTGNRVTVTSLDVEREITPGRLVLRTQHGGDVRALEQLCPADQVRTFVGKWDGHLFVLEQAPAKAPVGATAASVAAEDELRAKLNAMNKGQIETFATEKGAPYDKNDTKPTQIDKIVAFLFPKTPVPTAG